MDSELPDCLTPVFEPTARRRSRSARPSARNVRGARLAGERGAGIAGESADAALRSEAEGMLALARSLPADERRACARRAENRVVGQANDQSDPCICGEALLLTAAAGLAAGRAPLSAFSSLGEWG